MKYSSFFASKGFVMLCGFLPLAIFTGVFWLYPMGFTFSVAFSDWSPIYPGSGFVGLDNFAKLLLRDRAQIVGNSLYYSFVSVPLGLFCGFILALLLDRITHLKGLLRVFYFLPVVTPMIVVAILWRWIYQPDFGLLNQILRYFTNLFGWQFVKPTWLQSRTLAMPSLIIMNLWKTVGVTMVFYLAGMQNIPSMYYDSARVDGAKWWQEIAYITVPLIAPTTLFVLVTGTIGAMQMFVPVFVMTEGGPVGATETVVFGVYRYAFDEYAYGMASALAFVLFLILLILSLAQVHLMRSRVTY